MVWPRWLPILVRNVSQNRQDDMLALFLLVQVFSPPQRRPKRDSSLVFVRRSKTHLLTMTAKSFLVCYLFPLLFEKA